MTDMCDVVVEVLVDLRTRELDRTFDYVVPPEWQQRVQIGQRVYVSFGRQHSLAFVMNVKRGVDGSGLKPVLEILDEEPLLTEELLDVCDWMCARYSCTRTEAIQAILPSAFRLQKGGSHKERVAAKTEAVLTMTVNEERLHEAFLERKQRAPKQAHILAELLRTGEFPLRDHALQPSAPPVRALVAAGLASVVDRELYRAPAKSTRLHAGEVSELTSWQQRAVGTLTAALTAGQFQAYVLHGVTGSGKTEVYLRVMEACLQVGSGAIVLVPEISLTPQMVSRFTDRFGEQIAVLHSGLSMGEKRDEWLRIRRGEAKIAIGARSAVLAPVANLRLLIIDEEHETSYKQDETPRYDARDIAWRRMEQLRGTLVLGSATPSLQAMHRVEQGGAKLLVLPQRANGRPLPPVEIVDMRDELKRGNRSLFSEALLTGVSNAVANGQQAILFLNRRGYASFVLCRNCGDVPECPNCDITLTLHRGRRGEWLRCHYCGYSEELATVCSQCGEPALRPYGLGTQQVEERLQEMYPDWRILRMDVDTTRKKGSHQTVIQKFLNHEADVLIGTQMVAKGLDFPDVSFVGVVSADTMLAVPDYRAAERTFQLLTQVAGRAGRAATAGCTVIQTYRPDHYAILAAAHHDYAGFYERERGLRDAFDYPPFCELAVFTATHEERNVAESAARRFERELKRGLSAAAAKVLPAVPAGVERVDGKYRFQVVVKYSQWTDVESVVRRAHALMFDKMKPFAGTCTLDVNAGRI